ncbi:MAG: phage antirepressor KilAC domain-containing protein [Oscillospiraceae bacterium]|nr:phage antirepressor KilAC domain-containing protein [Oscillospiraceae bacterium]
MDNKIKTFYHESFGKIRTVIISGEPWFIGKDVAEILGYSNTAKAIAVHVDEEDRQIFQTSQNGNFEIPNRGVYIINESGLYSLILLSKLPSAKAFKRWVTSEVLPTIRKTGGYVSNEELFMETYLPFADESVKELFRLNLTVIRQLNEKIEQDKPLVDFANHVSASENLIDMGTMAKFAKKGNVSIGRTRLFKWLRKKGILMSNNLPYQRYIEAGYFEVKESVREFPTGTVIFPQTMVTGKGQQYLIRLLKAEYLND